MFQDNLTHRLEIEEMELPQGLHQKIMRGLFLSNFKTPFIVGFIILGVNLLATGWHLWVRAAETELVSSAKALFEGFEFSSDFLSSFTQVIITSFPLHYLAVFLVNLVIVVYGIYLYIVWQRMKVKIKVES